MKQILVLSLCAGVVLFVWGFISHVVLPWHDWGANKFTDENAISQALKENAQQKGMYYLPYSEREQGPNQVGAFANVLPQGTEVNMVKQLVIGMLIQGISAFLVLSLPLRSLYRRKPEA